MSIEIRRDPWGIPHLRGDGPRELAFAQGFAVALDRAWQIEVERHRSAGTSAAFLGPGALDWDRFARRARLDDTARRCFLALRPDTAAWVRAYVDGVEAGLREGARRAPEFAATGIAPGAWRPWTPLAIWLSHHILFAGFPAKLWREAVARRLGAEAIALFATDGPGTSGSNGWLVPGDRTATGRPIIAGDPHRFIEDPGIYQQVRLTCPEYDVVGLAVPGVPGIPHFGHTGTVAWAITNAMADYQDLYRERLRRRAGRVEALGPDGWAPAQTDIEVIEVAGEDPVEVEVIETERGPIVMGGPGEAGRPGAGVSLRHPPRVRAELGFDALPALLAATTVADVDRALDRWIEPVNVVLAADTGGGLLHRVAGAVPVRDPANRLGLVPAWEERYAWRGWHAPMPRRAVDGIVVMANQRDLAEPLGVEFAPPYRAERIRHLLEARRTWSAADMAAVHTDTHLASAGPLLDLVAGLDGLDADAARLRDRLLRWDRHMDAGSAEAMAYAALRAEVVRRLAAHPALHGLDRLDGLAEPDGFVPFPEVFRPWLALVPRVGYALNTLLTAGLPAAGLDRAALTELVRAALDRVAAGGGETAATWGEAHRLVPWRALPAEPAGDDDGEPLPGDHDCVLATSSVPGVTHRCARGPAARYVWDLARREDSRWVVPFGASGVPGDPHRRDQLPLWLRGELIPVLDPGGPFPGRRGARTDRPPASGSSPTRSDMTAQHRIRRPAVYEQVIEGFGTIRLVPVDPDADVDLIHEWVTQDRARFWGMLDADRERVLEIYRYLDSLSTHHAYLVHRDDRPVALFQTYEPAADPVGECYEVRPGDFGVHLLVGPAEGAAEPGFTGALVGALLAYALADPAHERIVAEPDARNEKAIARLLRTGFELGPEIDLPDKRARLLFLTRDAAVRAGVRTVLP